MSSHLPPPEDLLELLVPAPAIPPSDEHRHNIARVFFLMALLEDQGAETAKLFDTWSDRLRSSKVQAFERPPESVVARIVAEASLFLRGLGLAWPWLELALVRFFLVVHARAYRQRIPRPFVKRVPGALLRAIHADPGRGPKGGGLHLAAWTKWYYRRRVHRDAIRKLARERHDAEKHPRSFELCDCRRSIKQAFAEVERLLDTDDRPPLVPLVR